MFLKQLFEAIDKRHAAFCFGRMNPPTIGHGQLINTVAKSAAGGDYFIFTSQSHDAKKNPLDYATKIKFIKALFPEHAGHVVQDTSLKTIIQVAHWLYAKGYRNVTFVAGSDRLADFKELLEKYNGVQGPNGFYQFDSINFASSGDRDPDGEGLAGISATAAREAAKANNLEAFAKATGAGELASQLFQAVRKGMLLEGETDPYKKYPRAMFPPTKARNMRDLAQKRLDRYKSKKQNKSNFDSGSNVGSVIGGADYVGEDVDSYKLKIVNLNTLSTDETGLDDEVGEYTIDVSDASGNPLGQAEYDTYYGNLHFNGRRVREHDPLYKQVQKLVWSEAVNEAVTGQLPPGETMNIDGADLQRLRTLPQYKQGYDARMRQTSGTPTNPYEMGSDQYNAFYIGTGDAFAKKNSFANMTECSGYIPKNKKEAKDPRWSNALTVDVHPDTPTKNLKAFKLA